MSQDPVQLLIDAGAIPSHPLPANSRYNGVPTARYRHAPDDPGVPYLLRRFIAQRRDIPAAGENRVACGDRPDLLAARMLGDPELYWRIADANAVTDPFELTDVLGRRVAIPFPPGA